MRYINCPKKYMCIHSEFLEWTNRILQNKIINNNVKSDTFCLFGYTIINLAQTPIVTYLTSTYLHIYYYKSINIVMCAVLLYYYNTIHARRFNDTDVLSLVHLLPVTE